MLRNFTRPIPIMLTATLIGCDQAAAPTDCLGRSISHSRPDKALSSPISGLRQFSIMTSMPQ